MVAASVPSSSWFCGRMPEPAVADEGVVSGDGDTDSSPCSTGKSECAPIEATLSLICAPLAEAAVP